MVVVPGAKAGATYYYYYYYYYYPTARASKAHRPTTTLRLAHRPTTTLPYATFARLGGHYGRLGSLRTLRSRSLSLARRPKNLLKSY